MPNTAMPIRRNGSKPPVRPTPWSSACASEELSVAYDQKLAVNRVSIEVRQR